MKRSAIAEKYKWDLTAYAKDDEDFLSRTKALAKYQNIFKSFEGKLSDDEKLLEFLLYQTGVLIRMVLSVKGMEAETNAD